MELELLIDQLRRGQVDAESRSKLLHESTNATKLELKKARERLEAMPKRFTESLQLLRDEEEALEREKLSLQLAHQKNTLEVCYRD